MENLDLYKPFDDYSSSLAKQCVERINKATEKIKLVGGVLAILLFIFSIGIVSIFKGQPFMDTFVFGIPTHKAWVTTDMEILVICALLSCILAVVITIFWYKNTIRCLNSILLDDCDGYEYLTVASYGVKHTVNQLSEIVFQSAYVTALCIQGKFEEALEFAEPFENNKKKRFIWICVKLNSAQSDEEFNLYYRQLKKKGLFPIIKLYRDGKYKETIRYIRTNIEMKPSYAATVGSYYLAKSYEALNDYEEAFVAISGCLANAAYLPHLKNKARELYNRLSKKMFDGENIIDHEASANPGDNENTDEEVVAENINNETTANPDETL